MTQIWEFNKTSTVFWYYGEYVWERNPQLCKSVERQEESLFSGPEFEKYDLLNDEYFYIFLFLHTEYFMLIHLSCLWTTVFAGPVHIIYMCGQSTVAWQRKGKKDFYLQNYLHRHAFGEQCFDRYFLCIQQIHFASGNLLLIKTHTYNAWWKHVQLQFSQQLQGGDTVQALTFGGPLEWRETSQCPAWCIQLGCWMGQASRPQPLTNCGSHWALSTAISYSMAVYGLVTWTWLLSVCHMEVGHFEEEPLPG